jgi:uncharacterized protein DUF2750
MAMQRIIALRFSGDPDWPRAVSQLASIPAGASVALQLLRVDELSGVLIVTGDDSECVATAQAELEPWLAAQQLQIMPPMLEGATIFRSEPDAELARIDAMGDDARTELFVVGVLATQTVWGLYGKTWARSDAAGEVEALPLWPSRALAARCIDGAWAGFVPRAIELAAFLEQWLTGMEEDGIVAVLVPTPNGVGAIVAADRLSSALRAPTR